MDYTEIEYHSDLSLLNPCKNLKTGTSTHFVNIFPYLPQVRHSRHEADVAPAVVQHRHRVLHLVLQLLDRHCFIDRHRVVLRVQEQRRHLHIFEIVNTKE